MCKRCEALSLGVLIGRGLDQAQRFFALSLFSFQGAITLFYADELCVSFAPLAQLVAIHWTAAGGRGRDNEVAQRHRAVNAGAVNATMPQVFKLTLNQRVLGSRRGSHSPCSWANATPRKACHWQPFLSLRTEGAPPLTAAHTSAFYMRL